MSPSKISQKWCNSNHFHKSYGPWPDHNRKEKVQIVLEGIIVKNQVEKLLKPKSESLVVRD
jgi:hypothetical protein